MAGFYLFALAVALALLMVPYGEFSFDTDLVRVSPRVFLAIYEMASG